MRIGHAVKASWPKAIATFVVCHFLLAANPQDPTRATINGVENCAQTLHKAHAASLATLDQFYTLEKFAEVLLAAKLVSRGEVESAKSANIRSSQQFARALLDRNRLTLWQVAQIAHGNTLLRIDNRYVLVDKLGEGGMGAVFKAYDTVFKRFVVLKIPKNELIDDPDKLARFMRESKINARLDHPNIVKALDVGQQGRLVYMVLEFVDGKDLAAIVKQQGRLAPNVAVEYMIEVARALEYAQSQGITHRDLKPQNIILTKEGKIKVLDMGLARISQQNGAAFVSTNEPLTRTGAVMGTVAYMSPEQGQDARNADIRSDIYSLGCTLFHLLEGGPPFTGGGAIEIILKHMTDFPPPLSGKDVGLQRIVSRMLEKEPARRYQTPGEAIADLMAWQEGSPIAARAGVGWRGDRRWWLRGAIAGAVGTVGLGGGAWLWLGSSGVEETKGTGGAVVTTPTPTTRRTGWANERSIYFNGTNEYVSVEDSPAFNLGTAFTISAWVKTSYRGGRQQTIFDKGDSVTKGGFIFFLDETGRVSLGIGGSAGLSGRAIGSSTTGEWIFVVAAYDGKQVFIYQNSSCPGPRPLPCGSVQYSPQNAWIGAAKLDKGLVNPFQGNIDELAIWKTILPKEAVEALYQARKPLNLSIDHGAYRHSRDLVAYWQLGDNGDSLTTVNGIRDVTGKHNGTAFRMSDRNFSTDVPK